MKHFSFLIFISVVLLLSFLINFYVLRRFSGLFHLKRGARFWGVVVFASLSFVGASVLQANSGDIVSRTFYVLSAGWLGVLWISFSCLIVYEILRLFIRVDDFTGGIVIVSIVLVLSLYSIINAHLINIKRITIDSSVDSHIVQLSDIHTGSVSVKFVERVIEKTNALEPDMVLITGDLFDNFNERTQKTVKLFERLNAPVLFVTGNHEQYTGVERVTELLEASGINVLNDQKADLGQIQVAGVGYDENIEGLENILAEFDIDDSKFNILMYHKPVKSKMFSKAGIDLVLSGHTHSGQIFPFNYLVGLFHKPLTGLHKYNGTYEYVTSGTGVWGPRMRLGSKNEIVLFQIGAAGDGEDPKDRR